MKEVDFAIERGFRLFEDGITNFHFYMIQIQILKEKVSDGIYLFELLDSNKYVVYHKQISIDSINQRIITPNSHEDPLVEDKANNIYMICFQLWDKDIININNDQHTVIFSRIEENENILLFKHTIEHIKDLFKDPTHQLSELINDYIIISKKNCIFRLHLGSETGQYEEKEYVLKAGERFNFKEYLNYPYLGLQCSFENEYPEIEEKHIIIGQKGMTLTGTYINETGIKSDALLPFNKIYQTLYINKNFNITNAAIETNKYALINYENWTVVNSIKELIDYYKYENIPFFETALPFIERTYRTKNTYGLNKLTTNMTLSKSHLDLEVCRQCNMNSKCVQIIPSGLSSALFKKNIVLENETECEIYQLIESKIK